MAAKGLAGPREPLFEFLCDFHVHTCLSPCGALDASPRGQVAAAIERGLDLIVICDHNAAGNVSSAQRAAAESSLTVLAGIEICSAEEVHSVAVMPDVDAAQDLESLIWEHLNGRNDPDVLGMQVLADHLDNVEGFCDRLLIGAITLGLDEVARQVHRRRGLLIAAHVDRQAFGVIYQLGFAPPDTYDAIEVSGRGDPAEYEAVAAALGVPIVRGSDAHEPEHVGSFVSRLRMAGPSFDELALALAGEDGRGVIGQT